MFVVHKYLKMLIAFLFIFAIVKLKICNIIFQYKVRYVVFVKTRTLNQI